MSANNWALCPRCSKDQINKLKEMKANLEKSYGKVDLIEYKNMQQDYYNTKKEQLEYTLREDYEQGMIEEGIYYVSYGCRCTICGFEFTFNHKEKVND